MDGRHQSRVQRGKGFAVGFSFVSGQWLASAARPTHYTTITSDLIREAAAAWSTGRLERRSGRTCPQEEPVRKVLLGLGLEDEKMSDLHDIEGVEWRLALKF